MKKISLYCIITVASVIIRQFFLPNPFECFGESAALINWIAEPIMQVLAYAIVGLFYVKGSAPALGSLAYLFTYAAMVGFLWLCGLFSFAWWWVALMVIALILVIGGFIWLSSLFNGDSYD